jgi:hypothetical protein
MQKVTLGMWDTVSGGGTPARQLGSGDRPDDVPA